MLQIATWLVYKIPFRVTCNKSEVPTEDQLRFLQADNLKNKQLCFMLPNLLSIKEVFLPDLKAGGVHFYEVTENGFFPCQDVCRVSWTSPGLANPESEYVIGTLELLTEHIQSKIAESNSAILSMQRQMALAQAGRGLNL